ncbi:MAG: hypothetical protein RR360_05970, partial [Raoultibacter sp.]
MAERSSGHALSQVESSRKRQGCRGGADGAERLCLEVAYARHDSPSSPHPSQPPPRAVTGEA